jgi:replicative DNA helicase
MKVISNNGQMPPMAIELEESVLGSMLLEKDGLVVGMSVLKNPEVFYKETHQMVFNAIKNLYDSSIPVDILTVTNELRRLGDLESCGGPMFIVDLTSKINSAANIEFHIRIIQEMWVRRLLIGVSVNNCKSSYDVTTDIFEIFDKSARQLMKLQDSIMMRKSNSGKSVYNEAMESVAYAMDNPGLTGTPSNIPEIDKVTGGWQKTDLIVIAARPGMGKTAFAISAAVRPTIVDLKKPVLMFSFEMSAVQLMKRLIAGESDFSLSQMNKGYLSHEEYTMIQTKSSSLYNDLFTIEDDSYTINQLRSKAITHKLKHPDLELIIIDYIQLIPGEGNSGNREQEISKISRSLKLLAKELKVPIIALSQLSRSVETRGGSKIPQLSDLRESGAIEQDADVVVFLYRNEYYKIYEYEDGSSTRNHADVIFAKHRSGPLETVTIGANMSRLKFYSLELNPDLSSFAPVPYNPNKFIESGSMDSFESNSPEVKDEYQGKNNTPF